MLQIDPSDPNVATFRLRDADGKDHIYEVQLHPGTQGYVLSNRLTGIATGALGKLLEGPQAGLEKLADLDVEASALGPAVQQAIAGLPLELMRSILRYTNRDGKDLNTDLVFDDAYRRNYGELYLAVLGVVRFNRFFPVPDSFWTAAERLKEKAMERAKEATSGTSGSSGSPSALPSAA